MNFILCISFLFLSPLMASASDAGDAFQWQAPMYQECGQSCHYKKANEVISVDVLYSSEKVQKLRNASDAEILENLGKFCFQGEGAQRCFDRYREIVSLHFRKAAGAIERNTSNADALYNAKKSVIAVDHAQAAGKPQITILPTSEELNKKYQSKLAKLRGLIRNDYNKIVNVHKPSIDEYMKFRKIPRDPEDPKSEMMSVPDTSCGQPMCYDMAAFKKASAEYESSRDVMQAEIGVSTTPTEEYRSPAKIDDASVGAVSVKAYKDARDLVVKTAIKAAKSGKKKDDTSVYVTMDPKDVRKEAEAVKP
jgi:hypothetical protein